MFEKILHTFTSRIGIAGLNFLIVILTAQSLGAAGRGEISLFVANLALVLLFTGIVGGTALAYLTPRTNVFQLLLPAYVWSAVVSGLVTFVIFLLNQVPADYVWHLFGLALLQSFFTVNATVLLGKEKVKVYNNLTFLQTLLSALILASGFLLFSTKTIAFYFTALYGAYGISTLLSFIFLFRTGDKPDFSGFRENVAQLFRLGATAQFSNIITFLNYRLGYYFLNTFADARAVGIFSVGVALSEALWMIGKSMATVQYSALVNTENQQAGQAMTIKLVKLSFVATLTAVLVLSVLPPPFLTFVFGKDFVGVKPVIWALAPGVVATGTGMIFSHYFAGRGNYKINNWAALVGLALTVPACLLLIPELGPVGAGLASTFSYMAAFVFLFLKFRRESGFNLWQLVPGKEDFGQVLQLLRKGKTQM
ncbi:MATE family efflux transporter [Adhaeribacter soli]|nr:polysaccharide biosynthesis C-terminal domain-containing protein [Adhaeribacter soli]